jgi:hypothetical protein
VIFIETFGSKFVPETVTLVVFGGPLFGAREMVGGGKATATALPAAEVRPVLLAVRV